MSKIIEKPIKVIIFDLDGVIVSTDNLHYLAWKKIASQENIFFDETINNRLRGVSRKESLEIILEKSQKIYSELEKEKLMAQKNQYYIESLKKLSPKNLLPNVLSTIQILKQNHYMIAIGSSSKNTLAILQRIELLGVFDCISDGNNISRSKPYPDVFTYVSKQLNVSSEECLVIEDAKAGIMAAKAAKMKAAGIGDAKNEELCDYHLNNIADILKILE